MLTFECSVTFIMSAWQPNRKIEQRRLESSQQGWNLFGSSTTSTSSISSSPSRMSLRSCSRKEDPACATLLSPLTLPAPEDGSSVVCKKRTADSYHEGGVAKRKAGSSEDDARVGSGGVPSARRILIEKSLIRTMMEDHIFCPTCKDTVVVSFPTVCLASGCRIDCSNPMCGYVRLENPEAANVPLPDEAGSPFIVRSTDYSTNILFVLSFISSGDGGKEAERLLGLLGLSNATSMEKRSFGIIENRLAPVIQDVADEILMENLHEAVKVSLDENTMASGQTLSALID